MKPFYGFRFSRPLACFSAIGAVLWWHRCRSSDDPFAGIVLSFRARSDQIQSLKHLNSNPAETKPSLNGIGLAGVGPPVVFMHPPCGCGATPVLRRHDRWVSSEQSAGHSAQTCHSFFGSLISSPVCNDTTAAAHKDHRHQSEEGRCEIADLKLPEHEGK